VLCLYLYVFTYFNLLFQSRNRSRTVVAIKVGAAWTVSFFIACPLIALSVYRPNDILSEDLQCAIFNSYFLVYGSLAAFFGPLVIMVVTAHGGHLTWWSLDMVVTAHGGHLHTDHQTSIATSSPAGTRRQTRNEAQLCQAKVRLNIPTVNQRSRKRVQQLKKKPETSRV